MKALRGSKGRTLQGCVLNALPGRFSPEKETRYLLYRRPECSQGRSGRHTGNFSPPGFDPRTVQPVANRYQLSHCSPLAKEKKIKQQIYYLHYINCTIIRYNNTQTCGHPYTCCSFVRPSSKRYSTKKNTIMSQTSNGRVKTNNKIVKNIGIPNVVCMTMVITWLQTNIYCRNPTLSSGMYPYIFSWCLYHHGLMHINRHD
jgi:hypothetical protein